MRIAIVYRASGQGVVRDSQIMASTIRLQYSQAMIDLVEVEAKRGFFDRWFYSQHNIIAWTACYLSIFWHRFFRRLSSRQYDLAIYIESARPSYMFYGRSNVLTPNLEWLSIKLKPMLNHFDAVWCKTQDAYNRLAMLKLPVQLNYIGFSSEVVAEYCHLTKDYSYVLHRAGNSAFRGTEQLIALWQRHPEWPELRILMSDQRRLPVLAVNICYIDAPESDDAYQRLIAQSGLQLFPSQVEGYGLTMAEALGYGNVVMATDAAPMNELARPERAVLLPSEPFYTLNFAQRHKLNTALAEEKIQSLLEQPRSYYERVGRHASEWFEKNQREFPRRLSKVIGEFSPEFKD